MRIGSLRYITSFSMTRVSQSGCRYRGEGVYFTPIISIEATQHNNYCCTLHSVISPLLLPHYSVRIMNCFCVQMCVYVIRTKTLLYNMSACDCSNAYFVNFKAGCRVQEFFISIVAMTTKHLVIIGLNLVSHYTFPSFIQYFTVNVIRNLLNLT